MPTGLLEAVVLRIGERANQTQSCAMGVKDEGGRIVKLVAKDWNGVGLGVYTDMPRLRQNGYGALLCCVFVFQIAADIPRQSAGNERTGKSK